MLLLLYSHFKYKLSFYSILMSKYLAMASFPLFSIHVHCHMLILRLESYYFQMLNRLNLLQVLWPDYLVNTSKQILPRFLLLIKQNELIQRQTVGFARRMDR